MTISSSPKKHRNSETEKMETKYEEPRTEWVHESDNETLVVYLPGYKKEKVKVQVTQSGKVRVSGEKQVGEKESVRFRQEFPVPENCDADKAAASFREGQLYVKLPKLIVPVAAETQPEKTELKPTTEPPKPHQKPEKQEGEGKGNATVKAPPVKEPIQEVVPAAVLPQKHQDVQQNSHTKEQESRPKPGVPFKQVLGGDLVRKTRNPVVKKLLLAVLVAVVVFLYAKNAFEFLSGGSDSKEL